MSTVDPAMNLELEYIYGYRCFDTRQNIFYTSGANEIAYMAAAVGITLNTSANTQRFMGAGESKTANGHTDDITALCIHPDKKHIATGEVGKNPKVIVWSTETMQPVKSFRNGRDSRGITALAFSKDGNHLASCALDNDHHVRVWDWSKGNKVHEAKGGPDKILDANFNPTEDTLLTVGIKHIYFWNGAKGWDKKKGIFGKVGAMCTLTSCGFLSSGVAVTGGSNGSVYLWNGNQCAKMVDIHEGRAACHTLRIDNDTIYTGGNDHKLHVLGADLSKKDSHSLDSTPRAVDIKGNNIIVGCLNGDIVEISGKA
jgi:microtubule-associated protein-like 6